MIQKYEKLIKCIILLIIFICFTFIIKNYFKPFVFIIVLLMAANPLFNFFCKLKVFNKKINAILSILFVNLILLILIIFLGNFIINKIYIFTYKGVIDIDVTGLLNKISTFIKIDFSNLGEKIKSYYSNIMDSEILRKGAVYTTESILAYFVGNMSAYFILVDKYAIFNSLNLFLSEDKKNMLKEKIKTMKKMLNIEIKLVILTTLVTIFGFLVLNIGNSIMLGIICGILDILPYIGTIIVFFPLIFYEVLKHQYITAFGLIILYFLLSISRQILETKFMSSNLKIHPLIILLSLYIGAKVFGIIGVIMGPLYIIAAKEIILN